MGLGLGLGLINALLVRRAVESITAEDHPLKKKMALNSASRLLVITAIGLTIAFVFRSSGGLAVLFGLAIFQALLVMSTSNRFLRASERMRALAVRVEEKKLTPGLRALVRAQVDRTERQAVLLLGALRAAYTAIGSFASASLISILTGGGWLWLRSINRRHLRQMIARYQQRHERQRQKFGANAKRESDDNRAEQ